jgi:hypothetical protein
LLSFVPDNDAKSFKESLRNIFVFGHSVVLTATHSGLAHRNDPKIKVNFLIFSYFQIKV